MKKLIALLIVATIIISLASCVQNPSGSTLPSDTSANNSSSSEPDSSEPSNSETNPLDTDPSDSSNSESNPSEPSNSETNPLDTDPSDPSNSESNPSDTDTTIDKDYMLGIIDQIYRAAEGSVYKGYYLGEHRDEMIKQGKISEKNSARYFGTTLEFEIAVYSESNMEAVAYSMCLLKVKDGANIEDIKTAIKDNADPNKWECVTAESVVVEANGSFIILIMADTSEATALKNAFLSLSLG